MAEPSYRERIEGWLREQEKERSYGKPTAASGALAHAEARLVGVVRAYLESVEQEHRRIGSRCEFYEHHIKPCPRMEAHYRKLWEAING